MDGAAKLPSRQVEDEITWLTSWLTYLKRAQNQVENQPQLGLDLLGDEGEHNVVDPEQGDQEQRGLGQPPKAGRREEGKKQIADEAKPRYDLDVKHAAEKFATTFNFYIWAQCQKKKKKVCGEKHTSNAMRLAYEMLVVSGRKKKLPPL